MKTGPILACAVAAFDLVGLRERIVSRGSHEEDQRSASVPGRRGREDSIITRAVQSGALRAILR
jgi:hypothetical protein